MAFVAAATSVGAAVLGTGAAAGIGSTLVGGALIGAGIGGAYSAITGDGDILNSMLTGGLLGAGGAGLGSALGLGGASGAAGSSAGLTPGAAAALPSTAAVPTANVATITPAMQAAALDAAAVAEGATTAGMVGAANTGLPANTLIPASFTSPAAPAAAAAGTGLTGKEMLGYGLAGTAALSLLGGQSQTSAGPAPDPGQIRPYTYSKKINPNYGLPGEPYYIQTYEAGTPYTAKAGGLMKLAHGGLASRVPKRSGLYAANMARGGMVAFADGGVPTADEQAAIANAINAQAVANAQAPAAPMPTQFAGLPQAMPSAPVAPIVRPAPAAAAQAPSAQGPLEFIMSQQQAASNMPEFQRLELAPNLNQYGSPRPVNAPSVGAYNQILADRATNEYVIQPPPLSLLPGAGERASATDTQKLVNKFYLSELGRQGTPEELAAWAQNKFDTGARLADIRKVISQSPEAVARREMIKNAAAQEQAAAQQAAQQALEASPEYKAYMEGPITEANFDAAAYLRDNPDVADKSRWVGTPWQHYQQYGKNEPGRVVTRLPFNPSTAASTSAAQITQQTGYGYDPVTQTFTKPTPIASAGSEGLSGILQQLQDDPGFASFLQNEYNQYQQSQNYSGGKAGGLMPKDLKYAVGGGISHLGDYSDGGRLLKGPGDGVSDDIPAVIGQKQPARLADGEFVIPARIVSELGNGSTDAGAKRLYAMMDRIQEGRKKTVGKGNIAKDTKAKKHLLA